MGSTRLSCGSRLQRGRGTIEKEEVDEGGTWLARSMLLPTERAPEMTAVHARSNAASFHVGRWTIRCVSSRIARMPAPCQVLAAAKSFQRKPRVWDTARWTTGGSASIKLQLDPRIHCGNTPVKFGKRYKLPKLPSTATRSVLEVHMLTSQDIVRQWYAKHWR